MEFLLIWLGLAVVTSIAAASRGRSATGWFFLGFLFSGLALIAVLVMPNLAQTAVPARATAPAPTSRPARSGHIKTYKGRSIRRSGDLIVADGQEFNTVLEAERYIDARLRITRETPAAGTSAARPRILGDGHFDQPVVGTSHHQDTLARAADTHGRRKFLAMLKPEPDNPHDANAVAVIIDGHMAGHLPRDDAALYHEDLDGQAGDGATLDVWAKCVGGEDGLAYGLRLDMAWPIELTG